MNMTDYLHLPYLLLFAGIAQFGVLFASALTPLMMDWKHELQKLPQLLRQLFWVYGCFIVLTIIGLGTLTLFFHQSMADGVPAARGIAAFAAVFWGLRLMVQFFVIDARPYLTNRWLKLGYHSLTVIFIALTTIFGATALQPVF